MKLAALNPFIPKDPKTQAEFMATYQAELKLYRKRPAFWISLLVSLVCALWLIKRLEPIDALVMLPIVGGIALAHDTITSHFTKRLIEMQKSHQKDGLKR